MPSLQVKDGASWKTPSKIWVKNAGAWVQAQKVFVKNAGAWTQVFSAIQPIAVTYKAVQASTANITSYSLNTFGLSASDAGKLAIVCLGSFDGAGGEVPTGVTVGGVAASLLAGEATDTEDVACSIWAAVVSGSPTDNVTVTYAGAQASCTAALYVVENANATPYATTSAQSNATVASLSGNVNVKKDGAVFFVATSRGNPTHTLNNGLTETVDQILEASSGAIVVGHKLITADATGQTFTATPNTSQLMSLAIVSLQPA